VLVAFVWGGLGGVCPVLSKPFNCFQAWALPIIHCTNPPIPAIPISPPPNPQVGRTGSGKSTLLLALFRLLRIDSGRVLLDGIDVSKVTIDRLRSHLALIPQAPLLFSGSIRANLDPTDWLGSRGIGDFTIWRLLGEVGLGDIVRSMGGLDAPLPQGGASLSLGQKQLFSLVRWVVVGVISGEGGASAVGLFTDARPLKPRANCKPPNNPNETNNRALLRGAHVLAIDEGTANLDAATDATIQHTLQRLLRRSNHPTTAPAGSSASSGVSRVSKASTDGAAPLQRPSAGGSQCAAMAPPGCSLIVVAHRLETVAHTDQLLVMSQGRVLEQGAPAQLATLPTGVYAAMLRAMREAQAAAGGV